MAPERIWHEIRSRLPHGVLAEALALPSMVLADFAAGRRAWDEGRLVEALEQRQSGANTGDDRTANSHQSMAVGIGASGSVSDGAGRCYRYLIAPGTIRKAATR